MAINIQHTYSTRVDIHYYSDEDGLVFIGCDCDNMDSIAERICEVLVKHNFSFAEVYSVKTYELLMKIERS